VGRGPTRPPRQVRQLKLGPRAPGREHLCRSGDHNDPRPGSTHESSSGTTRTHGVASRHVQAINVARASS